MSKPIDTPPPAAGTPRDWFVAAIEAEGSVSASLAAVLHELSRRADFVSALKSNLELTGARGIDAITDLGQKLKGFENTLRFRLGILRPERSAAWFRAPAATSVGPFSSSVLEEPVFAPYDVADWAKIKAGLESAWESRHVGTQIFKDGSSCLWLTLLKYGELLERICTLPDVFASLRLDLLPDGLPVDLESRSLRAFLINVRGEVLSTRERLEACYRQLHETSAKLWAVQAEMEAVRATQVPPPRQRISSPADGVREEFKRRRATAEFRRLLTPNEMDAMRYMGFDDLPSAADLRQRYLTMARQLHPDLQGGSDSAFKNLTRAYERLTARL